MTFQVNGINQFDGGVAATVAAADQEAATADGWRFWRYLDESGNLVPLDRARRQYLNQRGELTGSTPTPENPGHGERDEAKGETKGEVGYGQTVSLCSAGFHAFEARDAMRQKPEQLKRNHATGYRMIDFYHTRRRSMGFDPFRTGRSRQGSELTSSFRVFRCRFTSHKWTRNKRR